MLNATAELNALGQLAIAGDAAADTVQLETLTNGDILLRDGTGAVIPIANHPGVSTSPLNLNAVTAGEITVDLGDGDDSFDAQLPTGIDLTIIDGAGDDSVNLEFAATGAAPGNNLIDISADTIMLDPPDTSIGFTSNDVLLTGNVTAGVAGSFSQIAIGSGDWTINGTLTLDGGVAFVSTGGAIDLSNAILSASATGVDADFVMNQSTTADLTIGQVDGSGGQLIDNIQISGAASLTTVDTIQISGQFAAPSVTGAVQIDSAITAGFISIDAPSDIVVDGDLSTTNGAVVLSSDQILRIRGDIDTVSAGTLGSVTLSATTLEMTANQVVTSGGSIDVNAPIQIDGGVTFDSGNAAAAAIAGNISLFSTVSSNDATNDRLSILAEGGVAGFVNVQGSIGNFATGLDLNELTIRSQQIQVANVGVTNGNVTFIAPDIRPVGTLWRTTNSGDILVDGAVTLPSGNTQISSAGSVRFTDTVAGQATSSDLFVAATDDVHFDSTISAIGDLNIQTASQVFVSDDLSFDGDADIAGDLGIEITASSITTTGSVTFQDDVFFRSDLQLDAGQVIFEGIVHADDQTLTTLNAPIADPAVATAVTKTGDGTLLLTAANTYSVPTQIDAGTLVVDGSIAPGSGLVTVAAGGRLEGDGQIFADVFVQSGGTLAPGIQTGDQTTNLVTESITTAVGGVFEFNISGSNGGVDQDQLVIDPSNLANENVSIDGTILSLQINGAQNPATEFILINNDGTEPISGRFSFNQDVDGNPLATPRVLNEGAEVLSSFGPASSPAQITYFGGDGNDVAIVTAGNVNVPGGDVTLISRLGINLEVRTGATLAIAETATPTIRTIAGLNTNDLTIVGTAASNTVLIDLNGFVDPTGATINFDGNIRFEAGDGVNDTDQLILFDSDSTTDDTPDAFAYQLTDVESGFVAVDTVDASTNFTIQFDGVEMIDQSIFAPVLSFNYGADDEVIRFAPDALSPTQTLATNTIGSINSTSVSFLNPTDALSISGGSGDDQIELNGFGTSAAMLQAPVTIEGDVGQDSIAINSDLNLGLAQTTGDFRADAENITIFANIDTSGGTTDGNVIVQASQAIIVESSAVINVGNGFIEFDAGGGIIDTSQGELRSDSVGDDSVGNSIRLNDASQVLLGDVVAADTLQIGQSQDVTGFVSQVGNTSITVDRFTASTSGSIDLSNADNEIRVIENILSVGSINIIDSASDLSVVAVDSTGNDVTLSTIGSLLLSNDAITANDASVELQAGQGIEDIDPGDSSTNISAAVISLTGGFQGIGQNISEIDVVATEAFNATTQLLDTDISVASLDAALPIGLVDAGSGNVDIVAVSIDDAAADTLVDFVSSDLRLNATTGVGINERLELSSVETLNVVTVSGGIDLDLASFAPTSIERLATGSGDIRLDQTGGQTMSISQVENQNGSVQITNIGGSINIVGDGVVNGDGVAPAAISVAGAGDIEINATGNASSLGVGRMITSGTGDVRLLAGRNVIFNADGDVESNAGSIVVRGDQGQIANAAFVGIGDGAVIDAGIGTIDIQTDGAVALGSLVTTNETADAILVVSRSSGIADSGDQQTDLIANSGTVTLRTQQGIGVNDSIESQVSVLVADATVSGAIRLIEFDEIVLSSLIANDGQIQILSGGTITAVDVQSINSDGVDDINASGNADSRDIFLTANGTASDILVDRIVAANQADVFLVAGDDILEIDESDNRRIESDDLFVLAGNASDDPTDAISLSTAINDLEISVDGIARGDIEIREFDSLVLAASDRQDDSERIQSSNGEIRVFAQDTIRVSDLDTVNDTSALTADPELVADGDNGRIELRATNVIQLESFVQLHASQSTAEAVVIESEAIELGEMIEINTGQGIGVARIFSPRPDVNLIDTAFYDSTSVSVNTLEQAAINDAEGQLTLDIGNEGERGLTINIDWGAESGRFQQIDNLSGDAPPLTVTHVYLESDILNSQLNGRVSETDPLNVRFSVRHHESIVVLGSSVAQAEGEAESVDGELVSSTDNPLTAESEFVPILENGTASFIIPSLSIPVAFFPVREVIPEIEEPEVFTRSEQTVAPTQSTFEKTETAVSGNVTREEYFQIRVLSPDPDGEDLAAPQRLPEDILDGDKLRELFSKLPDGRYEIEYVLGDGDERSILQVDLRDGKPIIPGDELDGGPLRLKLIDGNNATEISKEDSESIQSESDTIDSFHENLRQGVIKIEVDRSSKQSVAIESPKDKNDHVVAATAVSAFAISRRAKSTRFSAVTRFSNRSDRDKTA